MIKFKECPKCHGDLYLNQDMYGKYLNCLQCGYTRDVADEPAIETRKPVIAAVSEYKKAA